VHAPVGFGSTLYELGAPAQSAVGHAPASTPEAASGAIVFRSPSAGRFWHRSAPNEAALVKPGDVLESGRAIGLIEVMKTFTLVHYSSSGGLPARAKVVRILASDGAEVGEKHALLELAPA
jgi:biotin carboxyl carrier protein